MDHLFLLASASHNIWLQSLPPWPPESIRPLRVFTISLLFRLECLPHGHHPAMPCWAPPCRPSLYLLRYLLIIFPLDFSLFSKAPKRPLYPLSLLPALTTHLSSSTKQVSPWSRTILFLVSELFPFPSSILYCYNL